MTRRAASTPERRRATGERPAIEIHRSPRRRRTAAAAARDDTIVVRLPVGLAEAEEERLIDDLVRRLTGAARAEVSGGDEALAVRARELADRYLDGVRPSRVTWSPRMRRRHGSCTPADGSVRISRDVARYPAYVLDYVLVHELAHLHEPSHSPRFHALVDRYPHADRARGFLEGFTAGRLAGGAPAPEPGDEPCPEPSPSGTSVPAPEDQPCSEPSSSGAS